MRPARARRRAWRDAGTGELAGQGPALTMTCREMEPMTTYREMEPMTTFKCQDPTTWAGYPEHDIVEPPDLAGRPDIQDPEWDAQGVYCARCGWVRYSFLITNLTAPMAGPDPAGEIRQDSGKTHEELLDACRRSYLAAIQSRFPQLDIRIQWGTEAGQPTVWCGCGQDPEPCDHVRDALMVLGDGEMAFAAPDAAGAE